MRVGLFVPRGVFCGVFPVFFPLSGCLCPWAFVLFPLFCGIVPWLFWLFPSSFCFCRHSCLVWCVRSCSVVWFHRYFPPGCSFLRLCYRIWCEYLVFYPIFVVCVLYSFCVGGVPHVHVCVLVDFGRQLTFSSLPFCHFD